ncbi:pyridoxamine 5'-phosphate oxidase family protein [bacterium]|nr:pyridoxamine 5'-phosphate oxidase family protein [bacterium]
MNRPAPDPVLPEQVRDLALAVLKADRFPVLATSDGDQPRVRPVSPVMTKGFVVYIANLRSYRKTEQLRANPKVELCYLDSSHDQVRITGHVTIVEDENVLKEIWGSNPLLRNYLGTIDNPELVVYRVEPVAVCYMREWALEYHQVDIVIK